MGKVWEKLPPRGNGRACPCTEVAERSPWCLRTNFHSLSLDRETGVAQPCLVPGKDLVTGTKDLQWLVQAPALVP